VKDGIDIPFSAPGADESARAVKALGNALTKLRDDVTALVAAFEKDTQATKKDAEETEKAAKAKRSFADAAGEATDKANELFDELKNAAGAYAGVTAAALGFAAVTLKLAANHEQEIRTVSKLGGAYAQVQAATNGVVTAQEALKAQQALVQSGLRVSDAELAAITRKARDFALATGTDATQALDQLVEGLRQGEAGSLRKYGIAVDANKSRTRQFHDSLADLQKEQAKSAAQQTTLNEELSKTPGLLHSVVGSMANAVSQALGFDKALRGLNSRFQELVDLQRQAAKDQQKLATFDQRIALNQQLGRLRAAGLTNGTLATVDTTHMSVEQMARYQSLLGGINPGAVAGSFADLTDPTQTAAQQRRLNEAVRARMRSLGITNGSIVEEMNANDQRDADARMGRGGVGPTREIQGSGGSSGEDKSPDRSSIVEQLRAITRLRAIRGLQLGLQSFDKGANESAAAYVERIGHFLEERFVVLDEQLVKRRGETEFDFAKRRLDLVATTLKAIGDAENKAQEERARASEAAFNTLFEATKKDVAAIEAVVARLKAPKESAADTLFNDLKSGARTEQGEMFRLGSLQNDVIAANAQGNTERVTAIRAQADAIGEATLRYREFAQSQREANDVGLQLTRGMQQSAVMQSTAAQSFSKLTIGAVEGATNAWAQHFVAFAQGKESFDQALKAMTASVLEQVAIESAKYAAFQFFQGVGNLAAFNYPGAALNFVAAAGFTALAAGSAVASGELSRSAQPSVPQATQGGAGAQRGQLPQMGRTSGTPDFGGGGGNTAIVFGGPVFQTREAVLESLHGLATEAFSTRGVSAGMGAQIASSLGNA